MTAKHPMYSLTSGTDLICRERARQIAHEGWSPEHDVKHTDGSLAMAGACYASPLPIYIKHQPECWPAFYEDPWPWEKKWDKRPAVVDPKHRPLTNEAYKIVLRNRIRALEKAGALVAAEIDRLITELHWFES